MIIEYSTGDVLLEVSGKRVQIWGDLFLTPQKETGFYTSLKNVNQWTDGSPIFKTDKENIAIVLQNDFNARGWILEWVGNAVE